MPCDVLEAGRQMPVSRSPRLVAADIVAVIWGLLLLGFVFFLDKLATESGPVLEGRPPWQVVAAGALMWLAVALARRSLVAAAISALAAVPLTSGSLLWLILSPEVASGSQIAAAIVWPLLLTVPAALAAALWIVEWRRRRMLASPREYGGPSVPAQAPEVSEQDAGQLARRELAVARSLLAVAALLDVLIGGLLVLLLTVAGGQMLPESPMPMLPRWSPLLLLVSAGVCIAALLLLVRTVHGSALMLRVAVNLHFLVFAIMYVWDLLDSVGGDLSVFFPLVPVLVLLPVYGRIARMRAREGVTRVVLGESPNNGLQTDVDKQRG